MMFQVQITVPTKGKGLYLITDLVREALSGHLPQTALVNCFLQHTSASLVIQENADPTAREDLEEFFDRLAPENENWHRHTVEGPDDTTSHLKAALTASSLNIPVKDGTLALGTWQGLYLFEHRHAAHRRRVLLTVLS